MYLTAIASPIFVDFILVYFAALIGHDSNSEFSLVRWYATDHCVPSDPPSVPATPRGECGFAMTDVNLINGASDPPAYIAGVVKTVTVPPLKQYPQNNVQYI